MDKKQRRNKIADQIIQAFAALPVVQELIPEDHALYVKAVWDPQDQGVSETLLPYGLLLAVIPLDDIPGDAVQLPGGKLNERGNDGT